jgi:hypothetical protein
MSLTLISGGKQAHYSLSLSANLEIDLTQIGNALNLLRKMMAQVEVDPYILYSKDVVSTETVEKNELPSSEAVINEIITSADGLDLVGIFAAGNVVTGFANSAGQKNWFEKPSFNFSWSVYHNSDKAVKTGYAGYKWSSSEFAAKMEKAKILLKDIVKRYNIRNIALLERFASYFFDNTGQILSAGNIVKYLKSQKIQVHIDTIQNYLIYFRATRQSEKIYVQVAYLLESAETVKREFSSLLEVKDNYPKYVLSMDSKIWGEGYDGITRMRIIDFLLGEL